MIYIHVYKYKAYLCINRGAAWRHWGGGGRCKAPGLGLFTFQNAKVSQSRANLGNFLNTHFLSIFFFTASAPKLSSLPFLHSAIFSEKTEKTYLHAVPWCSHPLKSKEISCDSPGETHGVCSGWLKYSFPAFCLQQRARPGLFLVPSPCPLQ